MGDAKLQPSNSQTPSARSVGLSEQKFQERRWRALAKAFSWRVSGSLATGAIVYIFTGSSGGALAVGGMEFIFKIFLFYFHERIWERFSIGRVSTEDASGELNLEPCVIWFTGLPSSGKTTLAARLKDYFEAASLQIEHLDGDAVRAVVPGTGFSRSERNDHIRRMGFLASRFEQQGITVIASFVSPYRESRDFCRRISKNFIEVYLSTGIDECSRRDVKGLYKEASSGKRQQMTGVDDPYEAPPAPELTLDTAAIAPERCIEMILSVLREKGLLTSKKTSLAAPSVLQARRPGVRSETNSKTGTSGN